MSANKSSLDKARGEGRRAKLVVVVMTEAVAATRTMMKRVRTARKMLTRQLYICSSEILSIDHSWTGPPSALGTLRRQACISRISLRDHPGGW